MALYNCRGTAIEATNHGIVKHVALLPSPFTPIFQLNQLSAEAFMDYLLDHLQCHQCPIIYTVIPLALALVCCDGTF